MLPRASGHRIGKTNPPSATIGSANPMNSVGAAYLASYVLEQLAQQVVAKLIFARPLQADFRKQRCPIDREAEPSHQHANPTSF
jgi:hypothetical protein